MKVLLLASLVPHTGNRITADRIALHLTHSGHEVVKMDIHNLFGEEANRIERKCAEVLRSAEPYSSLMTSTTDCKDSKRASEELGKQYISSVIKNQEIDLAIGIHAWRAGRYFVDTDWTIPCIIIFGGTDVNENVQDPEKFAVMTRALSTCRAAIAFSPEMFSRVALNWPQYKNKIRVIPQAIAVDTTTTWTSTTNNITNGTTFNLRERLSLQEDAVVLLLPCGLRPVKDPMYLLNAVRKWHNEDERVHLVVVGPVLDGRYARRFIEEIRREIVCSRVLSAASLSPSHSSSSLSSFLSSSSSNGSCGAISTLKPESPRNLAEFSVLIHGKNGLIYHPPMSQHELFAAMRQANAVLNTSVSEGMSTCILEAMALGVPVITRNIEGNAAIVQHDKTGMLFSSPDEFLTIAKQLLSPEGASKRQALALEAQRYVSARHSMDAERNAYMKVIEDAMAPPQSPSVSPLLVAAKAQLSSTVAPLSLASSVSTTTAAKIL
eukprot:GEZU01011099.1.p1 GENE.GEZU01011099.1~~GEZU01011099.1.p1  ORF type:complete len:493 (-),score=83.88 GEZU01011099.1:536-2014(-)